LAGRTKGEMLSYLNDYLLVRSRRGATTAIIVDEAHLLSCELLEEIRLLTNLETSQHKLVQLVLVGQPELDQKLDSPELRQLKQRVSLRCQLRPLTFEESGGYIHRRLELAGANSHATAIFPEETIAVIYDFSRGIPRVINNLCENSLVSGYGKQMKEITVELVREVASDLRLNKVTLPSTEGQQGSDTEIGPPLAPTGETSSERSTEIQTGVQGQ
jgi:type II secretory pathway predicted ATPase ExeA